MQNSQPRCGAVVLAILPEALPEAWITRRLRIATGSLKSWMTFDVR